MKWLEFKHINSVNKLCDIRCVTLKTLIGDDLHVNLMDESLEFGSSVGLLPLVAMQRVHQPCDQPGGEDGGVGFVEVLEIS